MSFEHSQGCPVPEPHPEKILDGFPETCPDPTEGPSLKQVPGGMPEMGWNEPYDAKNLNIGKEWNADPMQAGKIIDDASSGNRQTIYRYSKAIRGCDEAMLDLFRGIIILDEDGKSFPVPIIWGTQEKAVQAMLAENVRKDDSNVVDRVRLPMLAICQQGLQFASDRYIYHKAIDYMRYHEPKGRPGFVMSEKYERDTVFGVARGLPYDVSYNLWLWCKYEEDANQILEQILLKFSPIAYISVRGVGWEIGVKLDSIADNKDLEPGDRNLRVIKYQFGLTAETFIPQPIVRNKAVLKTRTEILEGLTDEEALSVLTRFEEAVKELK